MGYAMVRYITEIVDEVETLSRLAYPELRPGFAPTAYVVLTRERGIKSEKPRG
jgi:hypothetical protein